MLTQKAIKLWKDFMWRRMVRHCAKKLKERRESKRRTEAWWASLTPEERKARFRRMIFVDGEEDFGFK